MKRQKTIRLFVLLGLFFLTNVCVVASTNDSIRQKSNRSKGIVLKPEFGLGLKTGDRIIISNTFANGSLSLSYQFNPYFSLGGGCGVSQVFYLKYASPDNYYRKLIIPFPFAELLMRNMDRYYSMPLFLNARVYCCDRKWSPYFDFKIGYNFALTKGLIEYETEEDNYLLTGYYHFSNDGQEIRSLKGVFVTSTFGMQVKNIDFGITLGIFNDYHVYYEEWNGDGEAGHRTGRFETFMLDFSYNIHFKK